MAFISQNNFAALYLVTILLAASWIDHSQGQSSAPADAFPAPGPVSSSISTPVSGGVSSPSPSVTPTLEANGSSDNVPSSGTDSPSGVFDVTKYGAVADGKTESQMAFLTAWKNACEYAGESTFLIPDGTFFVGPIIFQGPCYNQKSPKVEIRGTLRAPPSLDAFPTPFWITFRGLNGLNLTGDGTGLIDGQGESCWSHPGCHNSGKCKNYPCSLRFIHVTGGTIGNIAVLNSKGFHMTFSFSENILVHDLNITSPGTSPNTDGIHISESTNINITSSTIGVGDDCISIGPGNTNIDVSKILCGPGHGISVGSLGKYPNEKDVVGVHVKNCTLTGTENGVRVKTWPGSPASKAYNFTFEDIVVIDVINPIIIDQEYCPGHKHCNIKPSLVQLSDIHFKNIRGWAAHNTPVKLACSSAVSCENIELVDIDITYTSGEAISTCSNVKGGVTTSGKQNPTTSCL